MKIAILTGTYLPQINGVVTSTITFANELEKMGHQIIIMGPKMQGAETSTDKVWRFRSIPFPFQPEHRMISPLSRKLKKFKDENFDVIHIQTPFFMGHLGQYLSWKHKIPLVHTYHTYWYEYLHYFPLLPKKFRKQADLLLLTKNFCNRCDAIVVPSTQMADKLTEDGVTSPMTVIPTGINIDHINQPHDAQAFRSQYGLSDTDKIAIFVGRLGQEKNVYFLLDAFAQVAKTVPNTKLVICGDGPERAKMTQKTTQLGLKDRVIFTGYIDHSEIFTAYSASDVIMFPSKTETQGLSLLEGLSMGVPAVCLNAMGVKDIIGNNTGGFLVEESATRFAEQVCALLTDPTLYNTKKAEAKQKALTFSSTKMAEKLVEVYATTIRQSQTGKD